MPLSLLDHCLVSLCYCRDSVSHGLLFLVYNNKLYIIMTAILNIACASQIRYYVFDIVSVWGSEFKCVFISLIKKQETFVLTIIFFFNGKKYVYFYSLHLAVLMTTKYCDNLPFVSHAVLLIDRYTVIKVFYQPINTIVKI